MSAPLPKLSSRLPRGTKGAKSRAFLYFLREARIMRPGCIGEAKALDAVEGSLLRFSPLVAQALLFTLRNEGPVLLRPRLSLHHHLQSARTVRIGEPPTQ